MKKKYFILIFSLCIINIINIFMNDRKIVDDVVSKIIKNDKFAMSADVYSEQNYTDFYLLFDSVNLNTKNYIDVLNYFKDKEFLIRYVKVYSKESIDKKLDKIDLNCTNLNFCFSSLYNKYYRFLNKYSLVSEIEKLILSGVDIKIIKINVKNSFMKEFLNRNKEVKYSLSLDKEFKTYNDFIY